MDSTLPRNDVVLLGIGHTNAHVLRMWRMQPIPDARLTCVSNFPVVTYSGMLPGVLSGQYSQQRMEIDLVRLCAAAGARLVVDDVTGLNVEKRELLFANRPPLPFDVLSVGIGSVPIREGVETDDTLLAIKPMQTFLRRLESRLTSVAAELNGRPLRLAVVGGGVGGVEISLCLPARIRTLLGDVPIEQSLISADDEIPKGTRPKTRSRVRGELESRGVKLVINHRVTRVQNGAITLENGEEMPVDIVLWATGAAAPPLLERFDLPKDERGFLLTEATLQSTSGAPIFAVGDTGTVEGHTTPKAGVYAVRQGPVLWENIPRLLRDEPLQLYEPQSGFLKLLNSGDGKAIAEYKGFSFRGKWCWKLKDRIDGRFMDMYQDYEPMPMSHSVPGDASPQMRCAGCGGKIGGSVLSRVLSRLDVPKSEHVLLGLDRPDDAAIIKSPGNHPLTVTADFFAAPLDDPYIVGRIAALNAASDLFAMGAKPLAALALVTLPVGPPRQQEQMLFELMAGSLHEFRQMGATLIGGHTIEGPTVTIGFTMLADQGDQPASTKADLRAGDELILTKPLGTGVLLAAHMQAKCRADWWRPLLDSMLLSNQPAAEMSAEIEASAMTDVTGFGLAGHLLEMLQASDLDCELYLRNIPLLPGADELIGEGIASTLAPANRAAEERIEVSESLRTWPVYQALFDPQTCGGMLLAVQSEIAERATKELKEGHAAVTPSIIGRVTAKAGDKPSIRIVD